MKLNLNKAFVQLLLAAVLVPAHSYAQVNENSLTATFDDLDLAPESYWNGADCSGAFVSGSYKFINNYTPEYASWSGFSYSDITSTDFLGYADSTHYASAVGCGLDGTANFAIANASSWWPATAEISSAAEGETLRGFYVTNASCAFKAMKEGLPPARQFGQGDYLMLTITEPETGMKVEYYLVDYRSENEADHYMLDTWQWVDLRPLGNVKNLQFVVSGSDSGDWGLNTPAYFCMDDFNGYPLVEEVPAQYLEVSDNGGYATLDVADMFSFDNNGAAVAYSVDEVTPGENISVSMEGSVMRIDACDGEFTVVVKAVKKGVVKFISVPVTLVTDIEGVEASDDSVESRYTIDGKRVNGETEGINIIRMNNGNVKKVIVR